MGNVQNLSGKVSRNITFVLLFLFFANLHFFVGLIVLINLPVNEIQNEALLFLMVDDERVFFACAL